MVSHDEAKGGWFKRYDAWRWWGRNRHGLTLRGISFTPPQLLRLHLWQQQGVQLLRTRKVSQKALRGSALDAWQLAFTKAWSGLLQAGIAQLDALSLLQQQAQHRQVAGWLERVQHALHAGAPLHQSLAQCGARFSQQYCRLIEVGENSGQLPRVLQRLVAQREHQLAQRKAIRKAITYPLAVLVVAMLVIVAMLYFVVPQFVAMYEQMGATVPATTARLIQLADALRHPFSWLAFVPVVAGVCLLPLLMRRALASKSLTPLVYRLPVLGRYLAARHLLNDMATLQLAYASAMPLTMACDLTARSSSSALLRHHWQRCVRLLASGASLHELLQQNPYISADAIERVRLGEESGRLSEQLEQLLETWRTEQDDAQQRMMKLLEPLFLVITGGITAGILLALYIPLFQLGQLVG